VTSFEVQDVYNEKPLFYRTGCLQRNALVLEIFKNKQIFFSYVKGLLRTIGFQILV
jgi:hypothetical protein